MRTSGPENLNELEDVTLTDGIPTNGDPPAIERVAEEPDDLIAAGAERHHRLLCPLSSQ
jgi:hypothetical protein